MAKTKQKVPFKAASGRVDARASKTSRMFSLFFRIYQSRAPIALAELDAEEWGSAKTIGRTLQELNHSYERLRQRHLFEIVDAQGRPAVRGERYIKLLDESMAIQRAESLAVFPAITKMMAVIRGTILGDELALLYRGARQSKGLSRSEEAFLNNLERKFVYVAKGMKDYSAQRDVVDEVYEALLKEVLLQVQIKKGLTVKESTLRPLSLILYSNGLYLLAQRDGAPIDETPKKWRIESFVGATSLKDRPFTYPANFVASDFLTGDFGIFRSPDATGELKIVELEFVNDGDVKAYVTSRSFTAQDEVIEQMDGKLVLKFKVRDLTEVRSWVLGWGDKVTVLKPKVLRDEVTATVLRMSNLYRAS